MGHRSPLFCDPALAARIEAAETELIVAASRAAQARSGTAGFVLPIAGGAATFAGADSPFTKVVGLGFGGVPEPAALDAVEDAYAAHGAPVQVELAHLADPEIGPVLSDRGYRLEGFENVLGIALDSDPVWSPRPGSRSGKAATTSSRPGWRSWSRAPPTPTPRVCRGTTSSPAEAVEAAERDFAVAGSPLRRTARRCPRRRCRLPDRRRHRPARRRRHPARAPPSRRPGRLLAARLAVARLPAPRSP